MASLLDILEERQIKYYRHGTKPDEIRVCCPFCVERGESQDTRFRLGINARTGAGHCYNCGWGSKSQAPRLFTEAIGSEFYDYSTQKITSDKPTETGEILLPEGFQLLFDADKSDYWTRQAWKYITKRLPIKQIKKHNVGFTVAGDMHHRVIFPVIYRKELMGLVCRDFTGKARAKYLNSTGEKYLFNLPYRPSKGPHKIVLSEGILKALAIERCVTGEYSSALLGHTITSKMIKQLKESNCKWITLFPDPIVKDNGDKDRAGIKGMLSVAEELKSEGFKVNIIWPIPKKQADEYSDKMLKKVLQRRKKFSQTLADKIKLELLF